MLESIATYEQALDWVYGRINYERARDGTFSSRDFKSDRMRELPEWTEPEQLQGSSKS